MVAGYDERHSEIVFSVSYYVIRNAAKPGTSTMNYSHFWQDSEASEIDPISEVS